jgi:hypothetical protein
MPMHELNCNRCATTVQVIGDDRRKATNRAISILDWAMLSLENGQRLLVCPNCYVNHIAEALRR